MPNVLFCPLAQDENHTGARLQLPHCHMLKIQAMQEKKALHLARTGASQGFPRAAAPVGAQVLAVAAALGGSNPEPQSLATIVVKWLPLRNRRGTRA